MNEQINQLISDNLPDSLKNMRLVDATVGDLIPALTEIFQNANINPAPEKLLVEDDLKYTFAEAHKIAACRREYFAFLVKEREIRVEGKGKNRTISLGELKKIPNFKHKYENYLLSKQSNKVA